MPAQPEGSLWTHAGRREEAEAGRRVAEHSWKAGEPDAGRRHGRHGLTTVHPHRHTSVADERRKPIEIDDRVHVVRHTDEHVAFRATSEIWRPVARQVRVGRVEAELHFGDGSLEDLLLFESGWPYGEVGLAASKIEVARVGDDIEREAWVERCERRERWSEDRAHEPFGRRDADLSLESFVTAGGDRLGGKDLVLDTLGMCKEPAPRWRERPAGRGPSEEASPEALLEGCDPPADGRLRDAEGTCGRGHRPVAREGEEEAEVVPVEHSISIEGARAPLMRSCMGAVHERRSPGRRDGRKVDGCRVVDSSS